MAHIFLTGASGFVGTRVSCQLRARGHRVTALSRTPGPADAGSAQGDLLDPATYEPRLAGVDAVVHLAAVTGKAPPPEYGRVNVDGTRALLDAARRAGARRFLFCSTIAVTFPDTRRYFYAESKAAAERLVTASGIPFTVIRPTIVAGPGSPVMTRLFSLAALPLVPAFGGGRARVQPIHVDDLADLVCDIVETDRFRGESLELGGPEVLTLRDLLDRLHRHAGGRGAAFLSIPLGVFLPVLGILERVAYAALPLTVGQIATFRFDGIARPNPLWESRRAHLATVERMIRESFPPAAGERARLERECRVFTRFIARVLPTPYVMEKYVEAHRVAPALAPAEGQDRRLVAAACLGPAATRLADAYARLCAPHGALRKKLVLLLAILETTAPFHRTIDHGPPRSPLVAMLSLGVTGFAGALAALAGALVFVPLRLLARFGRRSA